MFTGIVQGVATIESLKDEGDLRTFRIELPKGFSKGIEIGASLSVDGVCLTVTSIHPPERVECDVMLQSLRVTTLSQLSEGTKVNVERAAKDGAEIGGHPLSGHIDFTGTVRKVAASQHNKMARIEVPEKYRRYVFSKGYIAINGVSLTMSEVNRDEGWFEVWLIPETRRTTTFDSKIVGDQVNVEIDRGTQVVVDTVKESVSETLGQLNSAITQLMAERGINIDDLLISSALKLPRKCSPSAPNS